MRVFSAFLLVICFACIFFPEQGLAGERRYAGSASCRECHEKFYQLWSTSRHGQAMQPYTAEFARARLTPQPNGIAIGKYRYRADIKEGVILESGNGSSRKYKIEYVLGGKNVYYFLTRLAKGRLQTLPVAYDVNRKEWLDTAASGMRHIPGERPDRPVNWKEWPYTFNTACYGCHVSQLSTNYDGKKDTYHTAWAEPGINCETCHGPAGEHNKAAQATPKGQPLQDFKIIRTKIMTKEERNALCASCHAKAVALTSSFAPGDRFFDRFDLITLESPDYYPDGRDLGENYTYTTWRLSPCAKSGRLDCMHCHTSSGRYRFKKEKCNNACMPCHGDLVGNPAEHTHHPAESEASKCVSCHMPMTEFARMKRSDHSMLPPTPAATVAFKSPNACNLCHADRDAAWADNFVRRWWRRDFQAPLLKRAGLVAAARKRDWSKLPEMLAYIRGKDREEVFAASLIRLMATATDQGIAPVLLAAVRDPSPLVRSAAVEAVSLRPSREAVQVLLEASGDDFRLVRVRAAAGLARYPQDRLTGEAKNRVERANEEYLAFLTARPDQWTSQYNLGNYHLNRGELKEAVASYKTALKLEPRAVMALVNSSLAYAQMGENDRAEEALRKALLIAPENVAATLNMGLLKAGQGDLQEAEKYLRTTLESDPRLAQAAYNLCVILARDRIDEAVEFCQKSAALRPEEPKYAYALAFCQHRQGDDGNAIGTLNTLINTQPVYPDAYLLLAGIYEEQGRKKDAEAVYTKALSLKSSPDAYRNHVRARLEALREEKTEGE